MDPPMLRGPNDTAPTAAEAKAEDITTMGDQGTMMCTSHPYRNNLGGICAFCLQDKLGKLVSSSSSTATASSSFPFPTATTHYSPSSSSSSPPSDVGPSNLPGRTPYSNVAQQPNPVAGTARRARIPFLLARRQKKKKLPPGPPSRGPNEAVLKRSKSSAGPASSGTGRHFTDVHGVDNDEEDYYSPRIRRASGGGFWSFLHLSASSSSSSKSVLSRKGDKPSVSSVGGDSKMETSTGLFESPSIVVNGAGGNQFPVAFERKVSRSRSVGCGSRSFSGDLFERISTGLGDCTLRRVESHREGHNMNRTPKHAGQANKMYKCGGIFGGFMMIASAPSSGSSYWVPSNAEDHHNHNHNQVIPGKSSALGNSRAKSWSWAFASPIRAFAKPTPSKDGKREINIIRDGSSKNPAPNLSAIPSLLTVGG